MKINHTSILHHMFLICKKNTWCKNVCIEVARSLIFFYPLRVCCLNISTILYQYTTYDLSLWSLIPGWGEAVILEFVWRVSSCMESGANMKKMRGWLSECVPVTARTNKAGFTWRHCERFAFGPLHVLIPHRTLSKMGLVVQRVQLGLFSLISILCKFSPHSYSNLPHFYSNTLHFYSNSPHLILHIPIQILHIY